MYQNYQSDVEIVKTKLQEQGINHYTLYPANNCIGGIVTGKQIGRAHV